MSLSNIERGTFQVAKLILQSVKYTQSIKNNTMSSKYSVKPSYNKPNYINNKASNNKPNYINNK